MKQEYLAYMEEENKFLTDLGLKEEVVEALPQVDQFHQMPAGCAIGYLDDTYMYILAEVQ